MPLNDRRYGFRNCNRLTSDDSLPSIIERIDLKNVFACFHKHNVRFVIIGGLAATIHGIPRMTYDLDILIDAATDNNQHLINSLLDAKIRNADFINTEKLLNNKNTVSKDFIKIDVTPQ